MENCKNCDLNNICSGIYEYKKYYNYVKAYPQKVSDEELKKIKEQIKKS